MRWRQAMVDENNTIYIPIYFLMVTSVIYKHNYNNCS